MTANILTNELDDYCEMIVCSSLVKFNGTHVTNAKDRKKGKTLSIKTTIFPSWNND